MSAADGKQEVNAFFAGNLDAFADQLGPGVGLCAAENDVRNILSFLNRFFFFFFSLALIIILLYIPILIFIYKFLKL